MFSVDVYRRVARAYIAGLRRRHERGLPIDRVASVASFFVSRVDTKVDPQLDAIGTREALAARGRAAIANAKLAYEAFGEIFGGDEFADLRAAGARVQRCLWASTSTKNPDYRDVLYVEELIGPETVDTMPLDTITAFIDHGEVRRTLDQDLAAAHQAIREVEAAGHQHAARDRRADQRGRGQLREELRRADRHHRVEAPGARPGMTELEAAIDARLESWTADRVAERLWARDGSLWAASGKPPSEIAAWLGWLDLPNAMSARVAELEHLARDVREDGYRRAAVLGMGGSSLAPELFSRVFDGRADGLELRVLDSTHPDAVRGFRSWASAQRTLFCVSSKSGTTTEPNAYQAAMGEIAPALDFLAITDPGTALGELPAPRSSAASSRRRRTWEGGTRR